MTFPVATTPKPGSGGGGGAVDSVNGQTGVVVLDADDVGAATAAQGLKADTSVQPGDLGDAAALDVGTTAGTVAAGDDARLTDDRDPNAHATSHQDGGTDELALDASQITTGALDAARLATGTATDTYVIASDSGTPTWTAAPGGGSIDEGNLLLMAQVFA